MGCDTYHNWVLGISKARIILSLCGFVSLVGGLWYFVEMFLNLKFNFHFGLSYDHFVELRFLSRYSTRSAGEGRNRN